MKTEDETNTTGVRLIMMKYIFIWFVNSLHLKLGNLLYYRREDQKLEQLQNTPQLQLHNVSVYAST